MIKGTIVCLQIKLLKRTHHVLVRSALQPFIAPFNTALLTCLFCGHKKKSLNLTHQLDI